MKDTKPSIIRKYVRQSRSPFEGDDSTILLLASLNDEGKQIAITYDRYIYLHRDEVGRWLGISLSSSIIDELSDDEGKYRSGIQALSVLLKYHCEIGEFTQYFSDEMESIFGIDAQTWLIACKARWRKLLKSIKCN
ncbi:MAG: hypothetical protein GY781_15645 [Gammaproteobacteria bacterium]|nr:hypothetical protein [Pseudoalteromonas sp.]MCP4273364.1 hypothetical protein [Gammaproteobacteria bacterium]